MGSLQLTSLSGPLATSAANELAALRIKVFREFPYLYEGDAAYERNYLKRYFLSEKSIVVLAHADGTLVGASTGMPLSEEEAEFRRPFERDRWPVESIFYFGESILLKDYRGQGVGHRFFDERERHAQALEFTQCAFCAVERPFAHPRRPANYRSLDAFWKQRGYTKYPELRTTFTWKDLDEPRPTPKPMVFWLRTGRSRGVDGSGGGSE